MFTKRTQTTLKIWLRLVVVSFLLIGSLYLMLPLVFLMFQTPSFTVGEQGWILEWKNDATGWGIRFNLIILGTIALIISLIFLITKTVKET